MPTYRVRDPETGRSVTLRGDSPPSEAELEEVFASLGGEQTPNQSTRHDSAPGSTINPASVGAANAGRAAAVRVGEQLATSPNLGRVVSVASKPAAQAVARAVGVTGGLPGYVAGEALTNPGIGKAVESLLRGSGELLARVASSPIAKAVTGPIGAVASLPFSEAGDGRSTPAQTASRQAEAAFQFKKSVNESAGREVITGNTVDQVLASIAAYRGRK